MKLLKFILLCVVALVLWVAYKAIDGRSGQPVVSDSKEVTSTENTSASEINEPATLPVDQLQVDLRSAEGLADQASEVYERIKSATVKALHSEPKYQAAMSRTLLLDERVKKARIEHDPDLQAISQEWIAARADVQKLNAEAMAGVDVRTASDKVSELRGEVNRLRQSVQERDIRTRKMAVAKEKNGAMDELHTALLKTLGETNRRVSRLWTPRLQGSTLIVVFAADDNLTRGMIKGMTMIQMADVLRVAHESRVAWTAIEVEGTCPLVDRFGNSNESIVLRGVFSRSNVSKINWTGFDADRLPDVADSFFSHPAFE